MGRMEGVQVSEVGDLRTTLGLALVAESPCCNYL